MTIRRPSAMLAAAAALALAPAAPAAPIGLNLIIPAYAQITGLSDVTFSNLDPTVDASNIQRNCTWTNSLTQTYTVTASGSGAASAFTLASTRGGTVAYSVGWAGTATATSTTNLTAKTPSGTFQNNALNQTCTLGNSTSSTLSVTIKAADLQKMVAGDSYTGSLVLVITPS